MGLDLSKSLAVIDRDRAVYGQFGRIPYVPLTVRRTDGSMIEDADGNRYLDLFSGSCTANIGFNHPRVVEAAKRQIDACVNYPAVYSYSEPYVALAEELVRITPGSFDKRVFFGLSGSDANDLLIKLARAYTGRKKIVAFRGSYHGSFFGSGAMTAIAPSIKSKVGAFVPDIEHIHFPTCYRCPMSREASSCHVECLQDFQHAMATHMPADEIAAVVMEPVLGDGGLYPPPAKYVQALAALCREHGILLAIDEVQQGLGRAGRWCAIEHHGIEPDLVAFGKSLGGGFPLSAVVGRREIFDAMPLPSHGTSLSAHATAAAAGLATLQVLRDERLLERSIELGDHARARFLAMQAKFDFIGDVRGIGLNLGIDLVTDRSTRQGHRAAAAKICHRCFEKGLLLVFLADGVLRFQPPLVIDQGELDRALDLIEQTMQEFADGRIPDDVLQQATGW